jgi:hypothetical protein
MLSATSYIFSTDTSASDFRRAVRRQVASRAEYALPGAGASAQEVQQAYLRYLHTNNRGMRISGNEVPHPHAEETEEAPPTYTATASSAAPTARLNTLLYSNVGAAPSPPEYEDVAASSPPGYEDVVSARTRSPIPSSLSSSATTTPSHAPTASLSQSQSQLQSNSSTPPNHLSHQNINKIFAGSTSRTHRKQLHNTAVQALCLVIGSDGPALPPRETKKGGWGRGKGKRRGIRGLRRV